jgi:RNA polymerase-binding transcription factor DksA
MATPSASVQAQLLDRREQLSALVDQGRGGPRLEALLRDVDQAVERLNRRTYGICEACGEAMEPDRLEVDPLLRFSLDHQTTAEARALDGGDSLVLYTDGVTETVNPSDEPYGEARLLRLSSDMTAAPPRAIVRAAIDDVARFRGAARRQDDATVVAVRRTRQARPA